MYHVIFRLLNANTMLLFKKSLPDLLIRDVKELKRMKMISFKTRMKMISFKMDNLVKFN